MNIRILQREVTAQRGIKIKLAPMRYKFLIAWGKYQGAWEMDLHSTRWRKNKIEIDMYMPISGAENCKYIRKGVRTELQHCRANPLKVALVRQFQSSIPTWALKAIRRKSAIKPEVVNVLQELTPEFLSKKRSELHSLRYLLGELSIDPKRMRYLTENMTKMEFRKIFRGWKNESIKYIHWWMHATLEERLALQPVQYNPDRIINAELAIEIEAPSPGGKYLPELKRIRTTLTGEPPSVYRDIRAAEVLLHEINSMEKQLTELGHVSNWRSLAKTWFSVERFRNYHAEQIRTFALLKAKGSTAKYAKLESAPPHCTQLLTEEELLLEGMEMHHCVGSYNNNCANGHSLVFRVETPTWRGTCEFYKKEIDLRRGPDRFKPTYEWTLRQVHGKYNSPAPPEVTTELLSWLQANQQALIDFKAGLTQR